MELIIEGVCAVECHLDAKRRGAVKRIKGARRHGCAGRRVDELDRSCIGIRDLHREVALRVETGISWQHVIGGCQFARPARDHDDQLFVGQICQNDPFANRAGRRHAGHQCLTGVSTCCSDLRAIDGQGVVIGAEPGRGRHWASPDRQAEGGGGSGVSGQVNIAKHGDLRGRNGTAGG